MSNLKSRYGENTETGKRDTRETNYNPVLDLNYLISFRNLRRLLGVLGIGLPMLLAIGTWSRSEQILPSISDYFYTNYNIWFVGIILSITIFLWTYNGEDWKEKLICTLASICAFFVAYLPTSINSNENKIIPNKKYTYDDFDNFVKPTIPKPPEYGDYHLYAAASFFILLTILVLWRFIRTEKKRQTPSKGRILTYWICGIGMALSILSIFIFAIVFPNFFSDFDSWTIPLIFGAEAVALILFGIAWLTKGEVQKLPDEIKIVVLDAAKKIKRAASNNI